MHQIYLFIFKQKYRSETRTEMQGALRKAHPLSKFFLVLHLEFSNQILLDMWMSPNFGENVRTGEHQPSSEVQTKESWIYVAPVYI